MTTMMRRPQNHILTNINNAAAVDCGLSQGLVSHDLLQKHYESERVPHIDASFLDRF